MLGQITCHRLTLEGKFFFVSQGKAQGKTENSVVMNFNVSANDINTFKVWNTMGKFCLIFKMSSIWANGKVLFPKLKMPISFNCVQFLTRFM